MKTILYSLETSSPSRYVRPEEAYAFFRERFADGNGKEALYRKVLLEGPVRGRHVGISHDDYEHTLCQDELIERFAEAGSRLAAEAGQKALAASGCAAEEICAVVENTCTGYLCPGLSSRLVEDLGMASSTFAFDLMGMGCGAAIPNLHCASRVGGGGKVLSVAVEVCSATLFDSADPGCIISNCIFADGAAAAVVGPEDGSGRGLVRMIDFESGLFPEHRESLRYVSDGGKLRNVLSRRVPVIGARAVSVVVRRLLERNGLGREDIDFWAVHPGGTAVLQQVGREMEVSDRDLRFSYAVFEEYGNMSSPSVLFVLKNILDEAAPASGQRCLAQAFGAGFSAHAMLGEFI